MTGVVAQRTYDHARYQATPPRQAIANSPPINAYGIASAAVELRDEERGDQCHREHLRRER